MRSFSIHILLVLLILSGGSHLMGQSYFTGKVVAADNHDPLIGANIKVQKHPTMGIATDINGDFRMEIPPGSYIFVVTYTGMLADSIALDFQDGQTIDMTVELGVYFSELSGVEIKVGRFERQIEDLTVSMEVIQPQQIESKNTSRIEDILDLTPGLNILDGEPQIRGGSGFTFGVGSKVGVFVDGMPVLSGDANRPYWELISVENIKQIEVIKGASSVLSGASALSGAIYIRTARPQIKPLTKIRTYLGFYSPPKEKDMKWWSNAPLIGGVNFMHSQVKNNTDIVVAGDFRYDHGYEGPPVTLPMVTDTVTNFSEAQMAEKRVGFSFNIRKRNKKYDGFNYGVNGNFLYDQSKMMLAWLDDTSGFYRAYPGAVILQKHAIFYIDPFVNYYSKLGFRHSLKARVMHNNNDMSNGQLIRNTVIFGDYNFRREYKNLNGLKFIGGLSTQNTQSHSDMYSAGGSPDNRLFNFSGYVELEHNFFKILNVVAGFRYEYFKMNDLNAQTKTIFRAGASLKMMQETYLRMSIGQGYRFPSIAEKFVRINFGSFGVFDNPELVPETSVNAEIGVKQGFKFLNYFGYIDVAVFQQDYQNTVEYLFGFWDSTYTFALAGFKFLNTGKSRITGIDVSISGKAQIGEHVLVNSVFGYNYILPKSLEPDLVFTNDYNPTGNNDFTYTNTSVDPSKHILKYRFLHTVKADLEFVVKGFSPGLSFKYFSRIENLDKAIEDFEQATDAAGGSVQPIRYMDYYYNHNSGNWILDLRCSYFFQEKHKFSIIINNVANRRYSLRPLKAEAMRSVMFQYSLKL